MPFSWLPFGAVRASASARAKALASARLERLDVPDHCPTFVAGGLQTKGALPVASPYFRGAVYSSRGRGYARYNEDAALLFADEAGSFYAGVFDQAGGLGGRVRGAASNLAARRAFSAFRKIATGDEDALRLLGEAIELAHLDLVTRGENEVTTAVMAVVRPGQVIMVSSGDSAALRFDASGRAVEMTTLHEYTSPQAFGALTHAVGLEPESPATEAYEWPLGPGEWLLLCTDGLLDSGFQPDDLGAAMVQAGEPEEAVNQLATKVLRRMTLMQAKPDNLTMVVIHSLPR